MPLPNTSARKVFLSHSNRDRAFVAKLADVLRRHNVGYWYGARHIAGAKQWHDEIGRALRQCNWFVVVLSPDSVRSKWVKRELLFALNEDRYIERIVPVLRRPCKHAQLSWTLSEFQFVDFTADFDSGCHQLLRVWRLPFKAQTSKATHKTGQKRK
jgi:hypothetical protein